MLSITNHGGKCCGISHISGFIDTPSTSQMLPKLLSLDDRVKEDMKFYRLSKELNPKLYSIFKDRQRTVNAYPYSRPAETVLDRLIAYMKWIYATRPHGLIEATLVEGYYAIWGENQTDIWEEALLALKFKHVQSFRNSNSGKIIRVYHYAYDNQSWMAQEAKRELEKARKAGTSAISRL